MTYYMGWCFFGFFFPAFWERGGGSVFIVSGWAGEQLVSIRCQLRRRLCQGWGGGGHGHGLCVCVRGDGSAWGEGTRTQGGWVSQEGG